MTEQWFVFGTAPIRRPWPILTTLSAAGRTLSCESKVCIQLDWQNIRVNFVNHRRTIHKQKIFDTGQTGFLVESVERFKKREQNRPFRRVGSGTGYTPFERLEDQVHLLQVLVSHKVINILHKCRDVGTSWG